jgi:hypothetical protein
MVSLGGDGSWDGAPKSRARVSAIDGANGGNSFSNACRVDPVGSAHRVGEPFTITPHCDPFSATTTMCPRPSSKIANTYGGLGEHVDVTASDGSGGNE